MGVIKGDTRSLDRMLCRLCSHIWVLLCRRAILASQIGICQSIASCLSKTLTLGQHGYNIVAIKL